MTSLYFQISGISIIILLMFIFYSKKRLDNIETKIYSKLIIITFFALIFDISIVTITYSYELNKVYNLLWILNKFYITTLLLWINNFVIYILNISVDKKNILHKIKKVTNVINTISIIIIFLLPLSIYNDNGVMYSYGATINYLVIIAAIDIIAIICSLIKNYKNLKNRKYTPLFVLIILLIITIVVRTINPGVLLTTAAASYVVLIMYFTIENPDVKMLEQVSLAKDAAEKANHAKSEFLSNMSHEIRTPLNAIVGFSESLKEDDIPESAREKVDDIIMASNNLLEIVNGILDISKIEANKLEIINKEYDIKSMLDELVALTKARIGDKGLEFRINIDPAIPRVLYGDNIRLKQIILNILTNAVKYTKEGFIAFNVSTVIKDNVCRLIISVEDSGIGIKEESLPKLFSKFERLNVEKQLTIEGTGLGLAITKKLVELMNGKIVVQSVYGKGSKFTVSIDQRIISVAPPAVKESPKSESKFINANGARILLVDDNELNIKVASVLLKKYNFNIDSCTSGLSCLAKIKNNETYDIIFLDDMMPKMNGRETLKKLKEISNFNTPVIALTANAITGMKQEYLECGFDDYLAKPIEKLELERIIKTYINKINSKSTNSNMYQGTKSILEKTIKIELPILASSKNKSLNFAGKKILLVDDNQLNIKVAENSLKKYNFDITSVNSGSSCIEKVIDNKYDLIFMDDMMPELDGCQTLENLNTLADFNTPVILMTASSKDEVQDKLEKYNFAGYLAKPFNKNDLEELLTKLLN